MEAFDKLPPRLRAALAQAPLNMSAEYALAELKRGVSEERLLNMLEQRFQSMLRQKE